MRKAVPRAVAGLLVAWSLGAGSLADWLVVSRPLPRADVLVVLAGAADYAERIDATARLYRQSVAPRVLLTDDGLQTGWFPDEQRNPFFVDLARRRLLASGVPADAIEVVPGKVSGTHSEATLLSAVARERGLDSLLVVTSACHSRRAIGTFESVFETAGVRTRLGVHPAPDDKGDFPGALWWLTARGWRQVAGEYLKLAYYLARY